MSGHWGQRCQDLTSVKVESGSRNWDGKGTGVNLNEQLSLECVQFGARCFLGGHVGANHRLPFRLDR